MGQEYLDTATVDGTFMAWWQHFGKKLGTIHKALAKTKAQIGPPMPLGYVPPPLRKLAAALAPKKPAERGHDFEHYRRHAAEGRAKLLSELNAKWHILSKDLAFKLSLLPCYADPKKRRQMEEKVIQEHYDSQESERGPVASQGSPGDIVRVDNACLGQYLDKGYDRQTAVKMALASCRTDSPHGYAPSSDELELARRSAMLDELAWMTQNTIGAGAYGYNRAQGLSHEEAMQRAVNAQNAFDVLMATGGAAGALGVKIGGGDTFNGKVPPANAAGGGSGRGGMTSGHYHAFQTAARQTKRIIVVRNSNPASTPWIELGYPAKPLGVNVKSSAETGIVTATNAAQIAEVRGKGFFVIDADGIARNASGQELKIKPQWPVKPGQVVHPQKHKPLVADYDMLGVIDPAAKGRNLALAASDGKILKDWSNPDTRRVAEAVNRLLDQPRVLHGAHDSRFDLPTKGGAQVFFPDGTTRDLQTREDVATFYQEIGRKPVAGPPPEY